MAVGIAGEEAVDLERLAVLRRAQHLDIVGQQMTVPAFHLFGHEAENDPVTGHAASFAAAANAQEAVGGNPKNPALAVLIQHLFQAHDIAIERDAGSGVGAVDENELLVDDRRGACSALKRVSAVQ